MDQFEMETKRFVEDLKNGVNNILVCSYLIEGRSQSPPSEPKGESDFRERNNPHFGWQSDRAARSKSGEPR